MRDLIRLALVALALTAATTAVLFGPACGAVDNDGSGSDADTDSDSDSDGDGTTIYDVQQGNFQQGDVVTLTGVVVTSPVYLQDQGATVYVEEPAGGQYSGIAVYMWTETLAEFYDLEPGDVVNLTGEYTEYYDLSEITVKSPLDMQVTGTAAVPGPDVVDPEDVATGGELAEAFESVLVKVEGVGVTDNDAGYGEFVLDDTLHVDDYFFETGGGPSGDNIQTSSGDTFGGVTGILLFSFSEFKLGPRFLEDYEGWNHLETTIYDVRQGEVEEGSTVTIESAVVTAPVHETSQTAYVQEPEGGQYSGIALYLWDEVFQAVDLEPGDLVSFTGEYVEFYGLSEIVVKYPEDIEVLGTEAVPDPALVAPADVHTGGELAEPYESALVQVEDVAVTDANAGYGEFVVDDSLHVDDYFFDSGGGPSGEGITVADDDTFGSITGVLLYSYEEFKLGPRTLDDFADWAHQETTIFDVQQGLVDEGTVVTIESAVVTTPVHQEDGIVYVQEPEGGQHSGIALFLYSSVLDAVDLEPGDLVSFTGGYSEFYGMSEIVVMFPDAFEEIGTGAVPDPAVVAPADIATGGDLAEAYECVLVQVQDVTVTNPSIGYGSFTVTDGLIVDDFFFATDGGPSGDMPAVALDDVFDSLTGPLSYSFDEFRLLPRDAADMDFL